MKFEDSKETLKLIEDNKAMRESISQNVVTINNNRQKYWDKNADNYSIENPDDIVELCILSMDGYEGADVLLRKLFTEAYPSLYYTGSRIWFEVPYQGKEVSIPFPRITFVPDSFKDGVEGIKGEVEKFFKFLPDCLKDSAGVGTNFSFGQPYYEVRSLWNGFYLLRTASGRIEKSAELLDILDDVSRLVK